MAIHTVHGGRLDINMRLLEGWCVRIMTFTANRLQGLVHEGRHVCRMRLMAALTIPSGRRMYPFSCHFFFHNGVADQAEIRALGQKERIELCLVGIVTFRTLSFFHRFVQAFGRRHVFAEVAVAFQAKDFLMGHGDSFVVSGMGIMAGKTLTLVKGRMNGGG